MVVILYFQFLLSYKLEIQSIVITRTKISQVLFKHFVPIKSAQVSEPNGNYLVARVNTS